MGIGEGGQNRRVEKEGQTTLKMFYKASRNYIILYLPKSIYIVGTYTHMHSQKVVCIYICVCMCIIYKIIKMAIKLRRGMGHRGCYREKKGVSNIIFKF